MNWYSTHGTGATLYGIEPAADGRVQFTVWISILWMPILPLSSWSGLYAGESAGSPAQDEAHSFTDLVRRPHDWSRLGKTMLCAWSLLVVGIAPVGLLIWRTEGRGASHVEAIFMLASAVWPVALLALMERARRRKLRGSVKEPEIEIVICDNITGERLASATLAGPATSVKRVKEDIDAVTMWWWRRRVRKAETGMNSEQVEGRLGKPARIDRQGDPEIWYYDLSDVGSMRYSHCVAFSAGRVCQSYIGMSPLDTDAQGEKLAKERRTRRVMRIVAACWAIAGGVALVLFWPDSRIEGIPGRWLGYLLIGIGVLAAWGVNVFRGGPLDRRLDASGRR